METIEAVCAHIERHIGPIGMVFDEVISNLVHLDVYRIDPSTKRPFFTLVTSGMCDLPMTLPDEVADDVSAYAEMMICLPPDWRLEFEDFDDERNFWPVRLMKQIARVPHEDKSWLFLGHTIGSRGSREPIAPDCQFTGAMIDNPRTTTEEFWSLRILHDRDVDFFAIIPLYPEELEFAYNNSSVELVQKLQEAGVNEIVNLNRVNTCK